MLVHNNELMDDPPVPDGQESFAGGQNSFDRPDQLGPEEAALIYNGRLFSKGRCKKKIGHSALSTVTAGQSIQGMGFLKTSALERLLIACNGQMKSFDGSTMSGVLASYSPTGGAQVDMAALGASLWIVDGTQNMYDWNGSAFSSHGSPGAGFKYIRSHTNRLFAANYAGGNPDDFFASNLNDGGTWAAAFQIRINGDSVPVIGITPWFNNNIVAWKLNQIHVVDADPTITAAAGGAAVWKINKTSLVIGCQSHRSAIHILDNIYFLSREGVRILSPTLTNEGRYTVSDPISYKVHDWIDRINWNAANTACAEFYNNTYRLSVPIDSATTPNYTLVYNTLFKAWEGVWDIAAQCYVTTRFSDQTKLVLGMSTGKLLVNNFYKGEQNLVAADFQDDGVDVTYKVRTRSYIFSAVDNPKTGDWCEIEMENLEDGGGNTSAVVLLDEANENTMAGSFAVTTTTLPVTLPFDLTPQGVRRYGGDIMQYGQFRSIAIEVRNTAGILGVRAVRLGAYLETVEKESTP